MNEQTLESIRSFYEGQIIFVCGEGFGSKHYRLNQAISKSKIKNRDYGNHIWMRPHPIYQPKMRKYLFFLCNCQSDLEIEARDEDAQRILHMFASLISYVLFAAVSQE